MAGVDQIVETIISQAHDIAEETKEAARENANKLTSISKEKIAWEVQDIKKNAMAKSWEVEQRTLTMADLERRRFYLSAKQEVIESVFERALNELVELSDDEYFAYLPQLLVKTATSGSESVSGSSNDTRLNKAVEMANEKLGDSGNLVIGENSPIKGGFILSEYGVSVNCSFEMILRLKRDELLSQVASKLFTEDA